MTWLALGPAILAAGVAVGLAFRGGPAANRFEPSVVESDRVVALPSLAPLVDMVRASVVGVRTTHRPEVSDSIRPEVSGSIATSDPQAAVGRERELTAVTGSASSELSPDSDGLSRGTGVVFDVAGLVLTAHHLVTQSTLIEVDLPSGLTRRAEIVGDDPTTDLAVLRLVEPPRDLAAVAFADAEAVRQGDWVFTVGNPANFHSTVCAGVVGYVGRHLRQDGLALTNEYLQISGPVNPGNSGSPVFDLRGRMIGLTTRAAIDADGLGFALGTRTVRRVLAAMERDAGRVRRAHLGISIREAPPDAVDTGADQNHVAIVVTDVGKGLPADHAGLKVGDLIVSFDSEPLVSVADFYDRVTWSTPGREVGLDVVRGGRRLGRVAVELGELRLPENSQPQ